MLTYKNFCQCANGTQPEQVCSMILPGWDQTLSAGTDGADHQEEESEESNSDEEEDLEEESETMNVTESPSKGYLGVEKIVSLITFA